MGIVFQSYALFPHLSVARNIAFGLEMRARGKKTPSTPRRRDAAPGEAGNVCRAAAAGNSPAASSNAWHWPARWRSIRVLLLLDEPLSNLDAALRGMARESACCSASAASPR